jgi:sterol 3beta-glucosyltransferase
MFRAYCDLAADAHVIVAHFGHPAGRMAADALGKPYVSVMLEPSGLPTRHYPPPGGRWPPRWLRAIMRGPLREPISRAVNARLWKENNDKVEAAFGYAINRAREEAGLPSIHNLAADTLYSRDLNLIAVSRHVAPPAPDWGRRHRVTGWWFLEHGDYSRPPEVAAFLTDGPTPIAISLGGVPGTLPSADGVALSRVLLEAVRQAGVRAIIEPGGLDLAMGDLPEGVLRYSIPHAWLFPQVSAVLHHAGAGTTAATLKAGIPSVTLPDLWDQPYWAGKLHTLGCAPPPVWRGAANPTELAGAIRTATASPQIRARVADVSQLIRSEGGTGEALRLIEAYVGANNSSRSDFIEARTAAR